MDEVARESLVARACQSDPAALAALVDAYSPRVFGLLLRLTGRRDVAEDLLQETFLRVFRTFDRYQHAGKFEAWLFRIAANLARDQARQRSRRGVPLTLDAGDEPAREIMVGATPGPAEAAEDRELRARLATALDELSDLDREILLLRHYGELSFREIAELLDVPLGTALARAHRALGRLRSRLTEESGQTDEEDET